MQSRLLRALDTRIATCRDLVQSSCLRAEKAALLARMGQLAAARAELALIHGRHDKRPNALVSAWVHLAGGLIAFYGDLSTAAADKLERALALATAIQAPRARALSAAWLANMDYNDHDLEAMVRHLEIALATSPGDSRSALARACLVVAQAYHWAGNFDTALPWYTRSRQYAIDEGDATMLSALMYNMAWLRVNDARRLALGGEAHREPLRKALLGAESTDHFDEMIGTASLQSLVPILRAHILTLLGRHAEALALFEAHFDTSLTQGMSEILCGMLAERAWCRVRLGQFADAQRDAQEAERQIAQNSQADERAAAHGRLALVFDGLGDPAAAQRHRAAAAVEWQCHSELQGQLLRLLSGSAVITGFAQ